MKAKLSLTLDAGLVNFIDALDGESRSAKIERVLRQFRSVREDRELRRALAGASISDDEQREHDAWLRTMERDQWTRSNEATSGRSRSSGTLSRARA